MATPGELINAVATCFGMPKPIIDTYYRTLREHGMVSKAGRGPSAARPTPRDAAKLSTRILDPRHDRVSAVDAVKGFDDVVAKSGGVYLWKNDQLISSNADDDLGGIWSFSLGDDEFPVAALKSLKPGHSLIDCVEALIISMINGEYSNAIRYQHPEAKTVFSIELQVCGPVPSASVKISLEAWYKNGPIIRMSEEKDYISKDWEKHANSDFMMTRSITHETIKTIADLLRPDYIRKMSGAIDD